MNVVNRNAKAYASISEKVHFENLAHSALEALFSDHEKKTGITLTLCSGMVWEGDKLCDKWPTKKYRNSIDELGSYVQALEYFKDAFCAEDQTRAIQILKSYDKKTTVAAIYDESDAFVSALACLIPDFEYPNYSGLTIGEVLNRVEKSI